MTKLDPPPSGPMTEAQRDLIERATDSLPGPNPFIGLRREDVLEGLQAIWKQALASPKLVVEQQAALLRDLIQVLAGDSALAPTPGDKRFGDAMWKDNPFYKIGLQSYVAWTKAIVGFVDRSELEGDAKNRARFAAELVTDALAPTNTVLGNPAALRKTLETGGKNLVAGAKNFLEDVSTNGAMPAQVDKKPFAVGKNLALSPGMVVFRNPVLELIQYQPLTDMVHARPHLIVPPEVNKFYVFDLSPGKSIVEYLIKNGFQTFAASWRNPTTAERDWGMDAYVSALLEAMEVIRDITKSPDVNVHAACSGAMTAAALAGYLAARNEKLIHAMTLMVAVLGKTESTLGMFASPQTVAAAKAASHAKGILDGNDMNRMFAWLRPNDLVWNYWANNYLLGNSPPIFDILYWSNDSTRLPAAFHGEMLDMMVDDLFLKPGALKVLGTPIDLSKVTIDKFFVSGLTDHITPWKGGYAAARGFGGKNEFILSGGGHIQSLVNPPGNPKAKYFTNPDLVPSPDDWLSQAKTTSGTWWDRWRDWEAVRSGEKREAPKHLGSERYKQIVPSPGTYVHEMC